MNEKIDNSIFPDGKLRILYLGNNQNIEVMRRFLKGEAKIQLVCEEELEGFKKQLDQVKFNCLIIDCFITGSDIFKIVYKLFEEDLQRPVIIISSEIDKRLTATLQEFPFLKIISKENLNKSILEKVIIELVHAAQVKKHKAAQRGGVLGFEKELLKQQFYTDVIENMDEGLVTVELQGSITLQLYALFLG